MPSDRAEGVATAAAEEEETIGMRWVMKEEEPTTEVRWAANHRLHLMTVRGT